eukprot:Sspe_Gene.114644::Locus_100816_Transcript_1_1_Confidence_1.000_Length_447::g.114644::m.114644
MAAVLRVVPRGGSSILGRQVRWKKSREFPTLSLDKWNALAVRDSDGRPVVNSDITFYDYLMYVHRLWSSPASIEGKISHLFEMVLKNVGYVSLRCRAFNYSLYHYNHMVHKAVTNLLYNVRLQPLILHKLYHVLRHFHGGH